MNIEVKSGETIVLEKEKIEIIKEFLSKEKIKYNDQLIFTYYGLIGRIIIGDTNISIEPRIPYLNAMDYIKLILRNDDDETIEYNNNLSEYIIKKFIVNLDSACRKGLPKKYNKVEYFSKYISGDFDISCGIIIL